MGRQILSEGTQNLFRLVQRSPRSHYPFQRGAWGAPIVPFGTQIRGMDTNGSRPATYHRERRSRCEILDLAPYSLTGWSRSGGVVFRRSVLVRCAGQLLPDSPL